MNYVDVDATTSSRSLFWRNVRHVVVVGGGTLAVIGVVFWLFFFVLLGPYW
jgi:hypothetical protein